MGCNTSTAANKVMTPQTNRDILIENKLAPLLDPNHDLNINRKYTYLYTLIPNEYTNKGIHRTLKYVSLVPQKQLDDKKNEFWGLLSRVAHRRKPAMLGGAEDGLLLRRPGSAKQKLSSKSFGCSASLVSQRPFKTASILDPKVGQTAMPYRMLRSHQKDNARLAVHVSCWIPISKEAKDRQRSLTVLFQLRN